VLLALLTARVGPSDVVAQKRRVDRLGAIVAAMPFWQAKSLAERLAKPVPGDRLAAAFTGHLSTETRQILIGRLRARAASAEQYYSKEQDPRKDPKYVDNVLEQVSCWLLWADRYTVGFTGGSKVVVNADIDWKKSSKAMPVVDIQADEATARALVRQWQDVAVTEHYDQVVAFYRGPGGVVLPTWFSPETAPATYRLIMGVNSDIGQEAEGVKRTFRDLRNSMIIGAIVGGVLKFFIRVAPGGGGLRGGRVPPPDPVPDTDLDTPGAKSVGGTQATDTVKTPAEPAPAVTEPAAQAKLSIRERLTRFYERLSAKPNATNAQDAMRQLSETLDETEDELSGIPKKNPPPPPNMNDGRMYPPLEDFITRNADGSLSARTRAHRIDITADGKVTITSLRDGQVEFTKP
jgi:hypothetical protein